MILPSMALETTTTKKETYGGSNSIVFCNRKLETFRQAPVPSSSWQASLYIPILRTRLSLSELGSPYFLSVERRNIGFERKERKSRRREKKEKKVTRVGIERCLRRFDPHSCHFLLFLFSSSTLSLLSFKTLLLEQCFFFALPRGSSKNNMTHVAL